MFHADYNGDDDDENGDDDNNDANVRTRNAMRSVWMKEGLKNIIDKGTCESGVSELSSSVNAVGDDNNMSRYGMVGKTRFWGWI